MEKSSPKATAPSGTDAISVLGARVHNLKNIDVTIPRGSLTVITGLSGSGKSSLAFDTIFAEGQRRYIETFSAYARNFLGNMERPDVDKITGLSPVISIEQKTTNKNPRSTVGTTTEIYDFLRLLYARAGEAFSYVTGERMVKYTEEQIVDLLLHDYLGRKVYLLAPLVKNRKGHYKELFETVLKKGYLYVRVDGELMEVERGMKLDRYRNHSIEVVVDRLVVKETDDRRLQNSVQNTLKQGDGLMMVYDVQTEEIRHYSRRLMCPTSGISYADPAPHNFSFNSPQGACPRCKGLGYVSLIDRDLIIPDRSLSIHDGAIVPLGKWKSSMIFWQIQAILDKYGFTVNDPVSSLSDEALDEIFGGSIERLRIPSEVCKTTSDYYCTYEGLVKYIRSTQENDQSQTAQKWVGQFSRDCTCPECHGQRLNRQALSFRIAGRNIAELSQMDLGDLYRWINGLSPTPSLVGRGADTTATQEEKVTTPLPTREGPGESLQGGGSLSAYQQKVAPEILKEIRTRLRFLLDVGLHYLSLNRASASLSGGESQRIRLATQIGSQLVNVLYILDEPSIGLHQRDNQRLIDSLKQLRDTGNTIIVVEHDEEMMRAADWVIDIGPRAGRKGGEVVFQGTPQQMLATHTLTAQYLNGERQMDIPTQRRTGNGHMLSLFGCRGNNLKSVDISLPLGTLVCVTGVSGSGKSTLINETLQPILSQHFYRSLRDPLPYDRIEGLEHIDKVVDVDQSPLGRTPRSNPATYTGVFNDIRNLFVQLPEARIRGYKPGRFSFNVKGGRCETCSGNGYRTIEMNFLPDVLVPCEECHGRRYNRETLEVRFKGKSIADVLDMTINQAVEFFENQPQILQKIKVLQDVGLGYIKLGQPSTTLSGGESQRVKLATELSKRDTGRTLYILDEPTTGLHFEDIRVLLSVLNRLVDKGNTVIVIEHNLDVIRAADYLIDMGPEGGQQGGQLLFQGTPEQLEKSGVGYTSRYLNF